MKKKDLLKQFGERYVTIEHNGGYLLYDKKGKAMRSQYLFKGLFYLASSGNSYVFQDEYYQTTEELIQAMENWATTLPFSVELYNPAFKKSYMIECALYDYLESLGFVFEDGVYILSDATGKELCTMDVNVKDGKTCGVVSRRMPSSGQQVRWQSAPFTDIESAVGACNTLLSTYCLCVNSTVVNMMSKMTNHRVSTFFNNTLDMKSLSTYTEDARVKAIEQLEAELKRLKEE